jgi:hypothetical protein
MMFVYGDDSSDEKRQRVCAVAVVLGTEERWQQLESQWIARTRGVPFHARDCESDQGDYRNITHQQNKDLYKDLTMMLASSGLGGCTIAIDLMAQRDIFPDSPDISYYKAFVEILELVKTDVCVRLGHKAKFKFDISTENEYNAGLIYKSTRDDSPEMLELFASKISFGAAKECPRLQAADLLAYEGMKILDNKIGPKQRPTRKSWETLSASHQFQTTVYTRAWFEDIQRNMPKLEEMTGINREMYLNWLGKRNRQHSISNLVHFTNWKGQQDRIKGSPR